MGIYTQENNLAPLIDKLKTRFISNWWKTDNELRFNGDKYSYKQKIKKEQELNHFLNDLSFQLADVPEETKNRNLWRENIIKMLKSFAKNFMGWNEDYLEIFFMEEISWVTDQFIEDARKFNSAIKLDDIFQAIRNVWIMNTLQLLLGKDVQYSPSIFAYSMLYPYTDNYLDNLDCRKEDKIEFNQRFKLRLSGKNIKPENFHEKQIFQLVEMIEKQYSRVGCPQVFESLLAIHHAQENSILQHGLPSPYERDLVGISFEKGGTSVLADGYLVNGTLSEQEAEFIFGFGIILQLIDDLQDIREDSKNKHMTLFSQTALTWPLDNLTNKLLNFLTAIAESVTIAKKRSLKELIIKVCRARIIQEIAIGKAFFSKNYIQELEEYSLFRFTYLRKLHQRLENKYPALKNIIFVLQGNNAIPFEVIRQTKALGKLKFF